MIVVLAVVALAVSVFLSVTKHLGIAVPCDLTKGCEFVTQSKYSMFLGRPLSDWGILFTSGVIVSALLANHYPLWRKLLTWLLAVGSVGAVAFLCIQFFVLKAVCQYCLLVDITTIFMLLWDLNIEHRLPEI